MFMAGELIKCPKCGEEFELSKAIFHDIETEIAKKYENQIKDLKNKAEIDVKAKESEMEKRIKDEHEKIAEAAKKKAIENSKLELNDLKEQLKEKDEKLEESQKQELELRKKQRTLENKEKELELELDRKLDEEKKKIQTEAVKQVEENHRLKDAEKDKQLADMLKQIEELRRKADQGSQQAQGEILELVLEEELKTSFPLDDIQPVPKGISGADIIQTVINPHAKSCGSIIWETKRTKNWTVGWIQKLKDDQRSVKADIAVILTQTLPKNVKGFAYVDGVWITDFDSYMGLSTAIRMNLIQLYSMRQSSIGKNEKMEVIYNYLSGHEFKQRVQSIVEAFQTMKTDLDKEKISMQKHWSKREKEIERVITGTVGMYGDLEGIIGSTLPKIEGIELKVLAAPDDNEDKTS